MCAMRMTNCTSCGKLFPMLSSPTCPECREHEDKVLRRAKEILIREPSLGIIELAERLGEPIELLEKFLRERRLVLRKSEGANLTCELCGRTIPAGRRCDACELKVRKMAEKVASNVRDSRHRMHSLHSIKSREGLEDGEG